MNDFVFCSPTKVVFGHDAIDATGANVASLGCSRALVVYGRGSAATSGVLGRVKASLESNHVSYEDLGGVRPNPEVGLVRKGIELARKCNADIVVAIGGGSCIDCAKAIAFGVGYEGDVWDFFCGEATIVEALPVAAVLTLPAAGSEASNSCVISNDELSMKRGVNGDVFRPKLAILDPKTTFTLPAYQTAAGVTDMIAHICERYFSGEPAVEVTDNIACGIIRALINAAPRALADPDCYDERATIMWAGMLAHNDLCGCGLSAVPDKRAGGWESHGLEHEMSAYDPSITHGAGLAVIMPAWMRYVYKENPHRFLSFGKDVFGIEPTRDDEKSVEKAALATIDALQGFFTSLGMPSTLAELGLQEDDIDSLVEALAATKGECFGGFKKLTRKDTEAIYRLALA